MANAIQANAEVFAKHQANISTTLAHRFAVARATHNTQLLALLEQEQQTIQSALPKITAPSARLGWRRVWQQLQAKIANRSKLQAYQVADKTGELWWYAYNPKTGQSVYADSEAELRSWIEANYWQD